MPYAPKTKRKGYRQNESPIIITKAEQSFCYAPTGESGCIFSIRFSWILLPREWRRKKHACIIHISGCISRFALGFCKNKKKRTETLYQSFSPFMANDPNCDTNEPPLALGGSLCAKGVHGFFNCSVPYNPHPMPTWHPELVSGFFLNRLDCTPPVAAPLHTHGD